MPSLTHDIAYVCAIWSCVVFVVQGIGIYQLFRHYSKPQRRAAIELGADAYSDAPPLDASPPAEESGENAARLPPHVTVIRPVKGLEPGLYDCLASTFRQTYPHARMSIRLCVESRTDPAFPVLQKVVADFSRSGPAAAIDALIYVEDEDPLLHGPAGYVHNLGPNPKIRNISRAYREAPADTLIWIIDCNVWIAPSVAGRMVQKLVGSSDTGAPYKFVHQLPLVVETTSAALQSSAAPTPDAQLGLERSHGALSGAALDEMFMATTHAKFYGAINTVGVAPCIVGKSNMFRKTHLDRLTDPAQNPAIRSAAARYSDRGRGVDYFSSYICEDHLIGDLLWRSPLPGFRNHGLVAGDLAIQPMAAEDVSVRAYAARRVRWLRVRKWTVLLATLVEPGVESLLCAAYAAFALTTLRDELPLSSLPSAFAWYVQSTWWSMLRCWLALVGVWMTADWFTYRRLQACQCVEQDADTPLFARGRRPPQAGTSSSTAHLPPRPFFSWLRAWVGREVLALPIWTYAVLLGATVEWRGRPFRVRMDMSVVSVDSARVSSEAGARSVDTDAQNGATTNTNGKARVD